MKPDHDRLRRIVRVEARYDHGKLASGTGFRVAPGRILTAQHVVDRAVEIHVSTDPEGSGKIESCAAEILWQGETNLDTKDRKALDAVLLEDELPAEGLEPFHRWVQVPLGSSGRWEASGYPTASPDADLEYLWGFCHPAKELATYLKLSILRDKPADSKGWQGVSGAPVFVREGPYEGYLYAVMRSDPNPFEDELFAVGTPALLRNEELRRLLDFKDPVPPHFSLVEELRSLLEEDARLAERLATLDEGWVSRLGEDGTDELVDAICAEGSLRSSLNHLRRLFRDADPSSATAEQIRRLAVVLATILASREVPGGEELTVESTRRIHLGTASPNFAEALLASAYGTPCLFEKSTDRDLPRAYLRVPTTEMEAGIRAGGQVADLIEEIFLDLMEKDLDPKFLLPAQRAIFSSAPLNEKRKLLREALERRLLRLKEDKRRPAYLVADNDLKKKMGSRLETFLRRLETALPSLHLVELDTEQRERAIEQEDDLWPLWEILDLLPEE